MAGFGSVPPGVSVLGSAGEGRGRTCGLGAAGPFEGATPGAAPGRFDGGTAKLGAASAIVFASSGGIEGCGASEGVPPCVGGSVAALSTGWSGAA